MTQLRIGTITLPAADLGLENPLPMFRQLNEDRKVDFQAHGVPEQDQPGLGWQNGWRVLPYRMQDGYNRRKRDREFVSIVLENSFLEVTVLPEIGGKVHSIVHKPSGKNLLFSNPVFQPGNLALRDAWTSGGIEWNTPHLGHNFLTCSPLHAARVVAPDGYPVLRLYAWERVKGFPYQIDLHLPPNSEFLFIYIRLINRNKHELPMYWWTNMAVPEHPGGRVLAPADSAYKGMTVGECPVISGVDHSYSTQVANAYDLFFRIPAQKRPWIASVDEGGEGMIHTSTSRLKGRKLFAWGMSPGGRHWNEFLSVPGAYYQELQAGLAYTQHHSVPMPAQSEWDWTEAIGHFESDPAVAHSEDWQRAYTEGERILEARLPCRGLDAAHESHRQTGRTVPEEVLFRGLGWGALENRRARVMGDQCVTPELPFDDAGLGPDQEPWLSLLNTGELPERGPREDPGQYMIQPEWRLLLEESLANGNSDHWYAWYLLGVMQLEANDPSSARDSWERSLKRAPNGWVYRCLSVIESRHNADNETACLLLRTAWETGLQVVSLAVEYSQALYERKRFDDLSLFLQSLPDSIRCHDRIKLLSARMALRDGRFDELENILDSEFATIREGEFTLSELWYEMQEKKLSVSACTQIDDELRKRVRRELSPPWKIDFRMSISEDDKYVPPQSQG